ncbi:MAG: hypothetical protein LBP53_06985 [Candidatus Peribacteria bacterium]|jgi:hypothetical protein|nr:hypothetical protein [Candidatus Peribacteria bacterium]
MKVLTSTFKHLVILIIGSILAVIFAWMVYDTKDVATSVLSLSERAFIQKAQWDAAYKKTATQIEVFVAPALQSYSALYLSFLFSPSEVEVDVNNISSPYPFTLLERSPSSLLVEVRDFATGNSDEGIFQVPFSGNNKEITVEFVSDKRERGSFFSIGALGVEDEKK